MDILPEAKFKHGQIMSTESVKNAMSYSPTFREFVAKALAKYFLGNWGNVNATDWQENDRSVRDGGRIMAAYDMKKNGLSAMLGHKRIYILTEPDRSATTVLFSDEY